MFFVSAFLGRCFYLFFSIEIIKKHSKSTILNISTVVGDRGI
ncbi:hypothetical protein PROVALCAL_03496 [Providencia alcalifaciens DSM 30120]|uniref:Uncharacterized protein n=1 Tax=Providencia alcalifaciens DSM 30120 TaxID=520999 RepID=B6XJE5_9GAMM|nr:hypothetical protein PROVALCAL_03496 [Providencia alcalifaciens DSM 30120]